ncbi:hypothetical protein BH23ACT6_BH23ACT6_18970 [soil metagenome]
MSSSVRCGSVLATLVFTAVLVTAPLANAQPTVHAAASASPAQKATGEFTASVDLDSLAVREVRGNKCEFTVDGTLTFTGSLSGVADGTTTAVIFAPCSEATAAPPGTYFDVFRFEGDFAGEVNGAPVDGDLTYAGITRVGGAIGATILLRGDGAKAAVRADAQVAVGGSYRGIVLSG